MGVENAVDTPAETKGTSDKREETLALGGGVTEKIRVFSTIRYTGCSVVYCVMGAKGSSGVLAMCAYE
jgi:hypothetical protein